MMRRLKMTKYSKKIKVFYNDAQAIDSNVGFSKSPNKPKLLLQFLKKNKLMNNFHMVSDFKPFSKKDFHTAHTEEYVNNFFLGTGNCGSNGLSWNKEFAKSVTYTNASLYNAIKHSILNPKDICFSPTSGFHHARPNGGAGFCTFSGQVIASVKLYNEFGMKGAYLDLDGHYGNSIEDSREFVKTKDGLTLNDILPRDCNINPSGHGKTYLMSLKIHLKNLSVKLLNGEVNYVVACSGADSLVDDDLGGHLNYSDWVKAKNLIYKTVKKCSEILGRPIPLTISLFGGYRGDHYDSVLDAHTRDLLECMNVLQEKSEPSKNYIKVYKFKRSGLSY